MALLRSVATVGSYTLLSRVFGFVRDVLTAAILGAGPVADAFFVALRLPNHFRAIFAEGAFNAAFVPAYARIRQQGGAGAAQVFANRVFTLLFASQVILLALAWLLTPQVIARFLNAPAGARATYEGQPGHPVVLGPEQLRVVSALTGDQGARENRDLWRLRRRRHHRHGHPLARDPAAGRVLRVLHSASYRRGLRPEC